MQGIEIAYADVCINALVGAWKALMETTAAEALRNVHYGKKDTLGLDAIPEITVNNRIHLFDAHAILITEELDDQAHRRWPTDSDPIRQPLMFFCDPTDRSKQLNEFFIDISAGKETTKIGRLMASGDPKKRWEELFEAPAIVTGSTSAITCVRKGKIVFSVILNHISGIIFCASEIGVFSYKLVSYDDPANEKVTLAKIAEKGKPIIFPDLREAGYCADDCDRFVSFIGKDGYLDNLKDSMLFVDDPTKLIHHGQPPGPPRALYLSDFQKGHGHVGFIMANGEKIGEWMHWPAFVKFTKNRHGDRALRAYEIATERPWTKNGMLMSTSPAYSLFCCDGSDSYLDISRLRHYERPSQFRCMMVVVPYNNERIIHRLEQFQYREITDAF